MISYLMKMIKIRPMLSSPRPEIFNTGHLRIQSSVTLCSEAVRLCCVSMCHCGMAVAYYCILIQNFPSLLYK